MSYDVLVVDDSGITRSMVIKSLSIAKIPVRTCFEAADGREALEIMEDHWVDLVLADLNMPVMGGQELLKIMRGSRQLADVPVIVVTSENRDPVQLTEWWTAAAYVRKPFTPEEIRAAFGALVPTIPEPPAHDRLFDPFATILESVTSMSATRLPAGEQPPAPGEFFRARVSFSGEAMGVLSLTVPRSLAAQMAAGALGLEPDDPVALNHDADMVGELLNIACGHVLDIVAEGQEVKLEPPVIVRHDASKWDELARDRMKMWCLVGGQPVMLGLAMRAPR
jgi:two-component system, chemotaxis family, chemotaxis protein CheY